MKQDENDQNHKKESTPVVDNKPNGKSQVMSWKQSPINSDNCQGNDEEHGRRKICGRGIPLTTHKHRQSGWPRPTDLNRQFLPWTSSDFRRG